MLKRNVFRGFFIISLVTEITQSSLLFQWPKIMKKKGDILKENNTHTHPPLESKGHLKSDSIPVRYPSCFLMKARQELLGSSHY